MKVRKADLERDNAVLATRLGFLRQARRMTLQALANGNGTQRSNLSAFVTSSGRTRNVAYDKLDRILFSLGMLPDGTLTTGLHRWEVEPEMVPALSEILVSNEAQRVVVMLTSTGSGMFLAARVAGNILVFASVPLQCLDGLKEGLAPLANRVSVVPLDRSGDSAIQTSWMTKETVPVEKLLVSLLEG